VCEDKEAPSVSDGAVLIVEDDREIVGLMRDFLEVECFAVLAVDNGDEAMAAIAASPIACVLLDLMLPAESGSEVCRRIRQLHENPVLFLSARDGDSDKIRGLGLGADDYVVKSATPGEVVARVKAVLRRATIRSPAGDQRNVLRFDRLELDLQAQEARVQGRPVRVTAKEFAILRLFAEHPRRVFSRDHLFELAWGSFGNRSAGRTTSGRSACRSTATTRLTRVGRSTPVGVARSRGPIRHRLGSARPQASGPAGMDHRREQPRCRDPGSTRPQP
jgi:DNA-binding response OmpR family regulator